MRTRAITAAVLIALFGTGACSVSGSITTTVKVDSAELEKQVTDKLQDKLPPDSVSCPDGLRAKVGATTKCVVIADDLRYTAKITATDVKGKTVSFDIDMPPPATVPAKSLARQVKAALAEKVPSGVASVVCAGDLVGTVGETASCQVTANNGQITPVTTTVTSATFINVKFSIASAS